MEQKHSSTEQGPQRRPSNRRRRRRRRRSPAARAAARAANRAPATRHDAARAAGTPDSGEARATVPAPEPAAAAVPADDPRACPLCGERVDDLYTAIAYGERMAPAHFDCIVSLLGEREELEEGARLCYLGGGSFGIVQTHSAARPGDRGGTLLIRKRIEVEERDSAPAWREELRLPLPEQRRVNIVAGEEA